MNKKSLVGAFALAVLIVSMFAGVSALVYPATDIEIVVVDKYDSPIKGATVKFRTSSGGTACSNGGTLTTDSKGRVYCDNVDMYYNYKIEVTANKYQKISNYRDLKDFDCDDCTLKVVMRPDTARLRIYVQDEDGYSVSAASVKIESDDSSRSKSKFGGYDMIIFPDSASKYEGYEYTNTIKTDSSGKATFEDIESDCDYEVRASKSGYDSTDRTVHLDLDSNRERTMTLDGGSSSYGQATYTTITYDATTRTPIEGATVTVMDRRSYSKWTLTSNTDGIAVFNVPPACYDSASTKTGYGTDAETNFCLSDGSATTKSFYIQSLKRPPIADAGADQYATPGQVFTLDGSESVDPNGDPLTYAWTDSLGESIKAGEVVEASFQKAGTHVVTLTVDDGYNTDSDSCNIYVSNPQNCGDGVCDEIKQETGSCPQDCPICGDGVCGKNADEQEDNAQNSAYCPVDCDIAVEILVMTNSEPITKGQSATVEIVDPQTKQPIGKGGEAIITNPQGTVFNEDLVGGKVQGSFDYAGTYTIKASATDYAGATKTLQVAEEPSDWTMLIVALVIIIAIIAIYMFLSSKKKHYPIEGDHPAEHTP